MMKYKQILFVFPLLVLLLCSWVDRGTIDTYYGSITYIDSSYDVAHLSGRLKEPHYQTTLYYHKTSNNTLYGLRDVLHHMKNQYK